MTLRQRLLDGLLAAECAQGEAGLRRAIVDIYRMLLEADAASEREQGAPDSRIVPCYECARPAIQDGWSTPLCADCRPMPAAQKAIPIGADVPAGAAPALGALGWPGSLAAAIRDAKFGLST